MARQLEVVVGEAPLVGEEDEHERTPRRSVAPRPARRAATEQPDSRVAACHSSSKRSSSASRGEASTRPPRAAVRSGPEGSCRPFSSELDEHARELVQRRRAEDRRRRASSTAALRRRARRPRPGRARRRSPCARAARRARSRSGRSRAGPASGARALLEALRVPQRERREVREGLQQPRRRPREAPLGVAGADAEDAHHLAGPAHRRDDRAAEVLVDRVRDRLRQCGVVVREHRPATCDRAPREASVGGKLEADEALEQAVYRSAAEHAALGLDQETVHRLGVEQRGDLVDEPLQDRLQLELARHCLRGLEQRRLLPEPPLVLLKQVRRVQREADLARDRLGELRRRSRPRCRARAGAG